MKLKIYINLTRLALKAHGSEYWLGFSKKRKTTAQYNPRRSSGEIIITSMRKEFYNIVMIKNNLQKKIKKNKIKLKSILIPFDEASSMSEVLRSNYVSIKEKNQFFSIKSKQMHL